MSYQVIERLQKKAIFVRQSCRFLAVRGAGPYCTQSGLAKPLLFEVGVHLKGAFIPSRRNYGSRRLISALAAHLCPISRRKKSCHRLHRRLLQLHRLDCVLCGLGNLAPAVFERNIAAKNLALCLN